MKPSRLICSAGSSRHTLTAAPSCHLTSRIMPVSTVSHEDRQPPSNSTKHCSSSAGPYTAAEYTRNPDHVARTSDHNEESYILALRTDANHHKTMTALRNKYFPKHINKLEAHISLFRALPGSKLSDPIIPDIEALSRTQTPFRMNASTPFRLKHGVAVSLDKNGTTSASQIHRELKGRWAAAGFLSAQDNGGFQAHYTLQNKVDDEGKVKKTMEELENEFKGCEGTVGGLTLWRYDRGYWRKEKDFKFGRG